MHKVDWVKREPGQKPLNTDLIYISKAHWNANAAPDAYVELPE